MPTDALPKNFPRSAGAATSSPGPAAPSQVLVCTGAAPPLRYGPEGPPLRYGPEGPPPPSSLRLLSRRALLGRGLATGALLLAGGPLARLLAADGAEPARPRHALSVIQVWLWGGLSHLDSFDPKPGAGRDYHGGAGKVITAKNGAELSPLLPRLAALSDHYALLRGLTHGNNGHETASYLVQTGRPADGGPSYPGFGAVVTHALGAIPGCKLPAGITLVRNQGRFDEAGFLGSPARPYATGGDPAKDPFLVDGLVADGVDEDRQRLRRELLGRLDRFGGAQAQQPLVQALAANRSAADELILGPAGRAFALDEEAAEMRDRYGRTTFGQSCLAARRLVERGVRYVTINSPGWDHHKQIAQAMNKRLPDLDAGVAALLQDLGERGLLDRTIVWLTGEFGRTPQIQWEAPWNGGRGHYGKAFSGLLAGGGFIGGKVVGATDATGSTVSERPIAPWDVIGSMAERLGIDPALTLPGADGAALPWAPPAGALRTPGLLREIMT